MNNIENNSETVKDKVVSVIDDICMDNYFFYVPARSVWDKWKDYMEDCKK